MLFCVSSCDSRPHSHITHTAWPCYPCHFHQGDIPICPHWSGCSESLPGVTGAMSPHLILRSNICLLLEGICCHCGRPQEPQALRLSA